MKKILIVVITLLIFVSSSTLAQFKIGPRFGINIGSISYDPELQAGIEQSSNLGLMFGAAAEMGIAGPVYIEVELLYIQKGEELTGFVNNLPAEQVSTANYLQIPILVKAKIPAGPISPYAFLGPNIGILLSASRELTVQGQSQGETDIKSELKSIDFALDFGAGIGFNIAPVITLFFDARYSLGLSNILDAAQQQQQQAEPSASTRGIQMMIGAMFGL